LKDGANLLTVIVSGLCTVFLGMITWAILTVVPSIMELSTKVAVVVERVAVHEIRLERLETKRVK
jgi:hypothetical protein